MTGEVRNDRWSPAEEQMALYWLEKGISDKEFERRVGRKKQAAKSHFYYMQHKDELSMRRSDAYAKRHDGCVKRQVKPSRQYVPTHHGDHVRTVARPTEEMIADAIRRNNAPRTLTALINGDPAPGESALDRLFQRKGSSNPSPGRGVSPSSKVQVVPPS